MIIIYLPFIIIIISLSLSLSLFLSFFRFFSCCCFCFCLFSCWKLNWYSGRFSFSRHSSVINGCLHSSLGFIFSFNADNCPRGGEGETGGRVKDSIDSRLVLDLLRWSIHEPRKNLHRLRWMSPLRRWADRRWLNRINRPRLKVESGRTSDLNRFRLVSVPLNILWECDWIESSARSSWPGQPIKYNRKTINHPSFPPLQAEGIQLTRLSGRKRNDRIKTHEITLEISSQKKKERKKRVWRRKRSGGGGGGGGGLKSEWIIKRKMKHEWFERSCCGTKRLTEITG